jgi:hypothetical protein
VRVRMGRASQGKAGSSLSRQSELRHVAGRLQGIVKMLQRGDGRFSPTGPQNQARKALDQLIRREGYGCFCKYGGELPEGETLALIRRILLFLLWASKTSAIHEGDGAGTSRAERTLRISTPRVLLAPVVCHAHHRRECAA